MTLKQLKMERDRDAAMNIERDLKELSYEDEGEREDVGILCFW